VSTSSLQAPAETGRENLHLADWRRRVAELYAEVRHLALADPATAHARWREEREALYRGHPASPVPAARRLDFRAIHFPYDPSLRFELPLIGELSGAAAPDAVPNPAGAAGPIRALGGSVLPVSAGAAPEFDRIGWLEVPFSGETSRLSVFWLREYSGGIFLPFRDGTGGRETYGGGRYLLDTAKGADLGGDAEAGTIVVDFNFAYQPSCAFDPRWSCPLSPPENKLGRAIRTGERIA
jgi:uncharacterized protein (DUF1684 family)